MELVGTGRRGASVPGNRQLETVALDLTETRFGQCLRCEGHQDSPPTLHHLAPLIESLSAVVRCSPGRTKTSGPVPSVAPDCAHKLCYLARVRNRRPLGYLDGLQGTAQIRRGIVLGSVGGDRVANDLAEALLGPVGALMLAAPLDSTKDAEQLRRRQFGNRTDSMYGNSRSSNVHIASLSAFAANCLTDWSTLRELISAYNARESAHAGRTIDTAMMDLRDALAHGRMSASTMTSEYRLIRFSKPWLERWLSSRLRRLRSRGSISRSGVPARPCNWCSSASRNSSQPPS
jgi:hypothetical protein